MTGVTSETMQQHYDFTCENFPDTAFEEIMELITGHGHSMDIGQYNRGIGYIDGFDKAYQKLAEKEGLNWDEISENAEKLKEKGHGDILHALNNLGNFTGPDYPRTSDIETKKDYLVAAQCFVLTAKSYFKGYKLAIDEKE